MGFMYESHLKQTRVDYWKRKSKSDLTIKKKFHGVSVNRKTYVQVITFKNSNFQSTSNSEKERNNEIENCSINLAGLFVKKRF